MELLRYLQARHNLFLKLFVVAIASVFIVWLLPQHEVLWRKVGAFDAVWQYNDLVASEDFAVKKTDAELTAEYESIKKQAPLFFDENTADKEQKLKELQQLKSAHPNDYAVLAPLLDSVYRRGVIESVGDSVTAIMISSGNYAEQAFYYDFFTIQSAMEFLQRGVSGKSALVSENGSVADFLAITHFLNRKKTELYINAKREQVALYKTLIRKGEVIVSKGEALTNAKRDLINRYISSNVNSDRLSLLKLSARTLAMFMLLMVLLLYLAFFRKPIFGQNKQVFFLYCIVLLTVIACAVFNRLGLLIMALPFTLVPILVRVFFDSRTALFTHLVCTLCCSFFVADKQQFILLQLVAGIGTLFTVAEMRKRQQIVSAAFIVFLIYAVMFAAYNLGFGNAVLVSKLSSYIPFAVSAMMVMLAYPLIFLSEKIFSFISDFKLLELCDLNQPLLRQLSQEVPGTFQHSLQVANLAEEAIYYIGGNSLLVRAGAMYHDIGKLYDPRFFTENQVNGYSPHIEMLPLESARTIKAHVIKGIELARKNGLPEQIIDFIRTHHGTTTVGYFLSLYKKEHTITKELENEFRYPGPIPFSKETAVLMMADGVEAASRSLPVKDALSINDLVDSIIDHKIQQNQFINSDITFKDISVIKKIFKKRLINIYHARIEYPRQ